MVLFIKDIKLMIIFKKDGFLFFPQGHFLTVLILKMIMI